MSQVITVGFITEGTTDVRFLNSIIRRTFDDLTWECQQAIDVYPPTALTISKIGLTFSEYVLEAARAAEDDKLMVLCVHTDADDESDTNTFAHRISPAFADVETCTDAVCKNLVAIVPVRMTEAWMLADKEALKAEIGTDKTDAQLGLIRPPESIADPKETIKDAIRLAFDHRSRRSRNQASISDLYEPLGATVRLERLALLPSYQKFQEAVREAFRRLNYLH
ncbi:DUF4276 family protein [Spirosoma sp. KUDC1026]|uniref:DUF4276 family protein n=1 Tax=Spirosoma sp. KUDC1026 TaxID=2745947 RepID=UPI00159BE735|nr:DUF4276 family protein [Spirosoma sp. KUDC1026]QKZ12964.1 DUF4276 family protein [Spirosoma sp. KUDC1026]